VRIGSARIDGEERLVAMKDDLVGRDLGPGGLLELIRGGGDLSMLAMDGERRIAADQLLAPLQPAKIVAIGLNYRDHADESGAAPPPAPLVFAKFPSSVTGPFDLIVVDRELTTSVDWEGELAVVVGKRMRNVPVEEALDHVFGYTVANDVSARDVQVADGQWVRAKSFDSFCPLGPWVVTSDEIADPQQLGLSTRLNGEVVQEASTSSMLFSVAELLSYCSRSFPLEPGDVVLTGTPSGVGMAMKPPRWLQAGDVLETEIEGIGRLVNPVVEANHPARSATNY
jgi:5-carboxymethyl-2-hydroxymuconate isomerase